MNDVETTWAPKLSDDDIRGLAELHMIAFPRPGDTTNQLIERVRRYSEFWQTEDGRAESAGMHIIRVDGMIVAKADSTRREVGTTAGVLPLLALGGVSTHPKWRGHGFGKSVVIEAWKRVDSGEFRFSLFRTTPAVVPFYEKLGACIAENPVFNSLAIEGESFTFGAEAIMRYPVGNDWPDGGIDLRGPSY